MEPLISVAGMVVLLGLAVLLSSNWRAINIRTVAGAFALQAGLAAFVLYSELGKNALSGLTGGVQAVISYGNVGTEFLLGDLARFKLGFIFAVHVLPIIIFLSSLMAVLYYLGLMQKVVNTIGGGISRLLGTSRVESVCATANIFIGQTESPLVVRPYIAHLTRSELFAVMTGGTASIAGAVMAGYASMGVELKYLIAASFMAAPGGLLMAKIIMPETEPPHAELEKVAFDESDQPANVFDAAAAGATSGLSLAMNVGAMLLAFIALIALLNGMVGGVGGLFGYPDITIEMMLGYVFSPLAFLLGVPAADVSIVASLIGEKLVLNEFVAYVDFVDLKDSMSEKSQVVTTFALCGFANLSAVAVLLGGLGGIVPERRHEIAELGLKAVAGGTLSNIMSAALAGFFFSII